MFEALEKKIRGLLLQIENKKITPAASNIGKWINKMKEIDEPCYDNLMTRYKKIQGC